MVIKGTGGEGKAMYKKEGMQKTIKVSSKWKMPPIHRNKEHYCHSFINANPSLNACSRAWNFRTENSEDSLMTGLIFNCFLIWNEL